MKKSLPVIISCIIVFSLFLIAAFWANDNIGVGPDKLEADIRSSQKISNDWTVTGEASDSMAAFVSYPEDKSNHTFSIYVKHSGLSYGYFFRAGGSIGDIDDSIQTFTADNINDRAIISMNAQKIARLEIDNGIETKTVEFDSEKPFAIVLPLNAGELRFYDANGNIVEYHERKI